MVREVTAGQLCELLEQSSLWWCPAAAAALVAVSKPLTVAVADAGELHTTYSVRLQRSRQGLGPRCEHLAEFVDDLARHSTVELVSWRTDHARWIVALNEQTPLSFTVVHDPTDEP